MPDQRCPQCGKNLNRSSPVDLQLLAPVPGDFTICIGCVAVLQFDQQMKLQVPEQAAIEQLDAQTLRQLIAAQNLILSLKAERQSRGDA